MRHLGSDTGVAVNRADSAPSADGEEAGAFPLSLPQLGLWTAEHMGLGGSPTSSAQYSQIVGSIDIPLFERASRPGPGGDRSAATVLRRERPDNRSSGFYPLGKLVTASYRPVRRARAVLGRQSPGWSKQREQPIKPLLTVSAFRWTLLRLGAKSLRLELSGASPDHGRLLGATWSGADWSRCMRHSTSSWSGSRR